MADKDILNFNKSDFNHKLSRSEECRGILLLHRNGFVIEKLALLIGRQKEFVTAAIIEGKQAEEAAAEESNPRY